MKHQKSSPKCKECGEPLECRPCRMLSETTVDSFSGGPGHMEAKLKASQDWMAQIVPHLITLLNNAENYMEQRVYLESEDTPDDETGVEMSLKPRWVEGGRWPETYVLRIQRAGKVTPHEARVKAEADRDQLRERVTFLEGELDRLRGEA